MWLKCSLFNKNCFFFFHFRLFSSSSRQLDSISLEGSRVGYFYAQSLTTPDEFRELFTLPPAQGGLGIPDLKTEAPHYYSSFLYAQHVHATGWAHFGRPETTTAVAKDNSGEYEKRGCWCISTTGLAMVDNAGKRQGCKLVAQHSTPWGAGADIE